MKRYDVLPVQLELPFDGEFEWCPACRPSGRPVDDMLRSMCKRHFREYSASFDSDAFKRDLEEALKEGQRHADAFRPSFGRIPGYYKSL